MPFANQSLSLIALQYELALLIGQDLRLAQMLRRFFPPALKLLGCRAAHVWLKDGENNACKHRFSYPSHDGRRLTNDPELSALVSRYALNPAQPESFHLGDGAWALFMPLQKRGFCMIVKASEPLGSDSIAALLPIFDRLATACAACEQYEKTEALRLLADENAQRFRTVVETVGEVIFELDECGQVLFLNPAWFRVTGRSAGEGIGLHVFELLGLSDAAAVARVQSVLDADSDGVEFSHSTQTIKGESRHFDIRIKRSLDLGGEGRRLIGTMVDTTEQRALIERVQHARARAEEANSAKSAFIANMSHEIRTPMNGVIGLAQVALDEPDQATVKEHLKLILGSADHLLTIINDILDFSKIEAGRYTLQEDVVNLSELLGNVCSQMRLQAEKKGLWLKLDLPDDKTFWVRGDATRLRQVLINLLGNAIKFTLQGGVTLRARAEADNMWRFEIEDTGIGVAPEKQKIIFSAFTQADDSIARSFGGTGLGLTISCRLVELMHGQVGLDSTVGRGSLFWFTARLASVQVSACANADKAVEASGEHRVMLNEKTGFQALDILVAEDNLINRKLMDAMLRQMGHNPVFAENGEKALAQRIHEDYHLILMDMQMPVMDGLTATRAIRDHEQRHAMTPVPIYALTANAMDSDRDACLVAGMDGFLAKPLRKAALQSALDEVINRLTQHE